MTKIQKAVEFHKTFGVPIMAFASDLSYLLGRFDFDIVSFNTWCKRKQGYNEDGKTSLKDFVKARWGMDGLRLIEWLIQNTPSKGGN